MKGKVIVSVSNDLVSDQRVHKCCQSLSEQGLEILLVGRQKKDSLPLNSRDYACHRMQLIFEKGALFYAEFNLRLFFFLLFRRAAVLHSNDLDTLLPNFLISKLTGRFLVYDSHEYFTEVPELVARPAVQNIWKRIEKLTVPSLKYFFTVNESIADLFEKDYGFRPKVLRNISPLSKGEEAIPSTEKKILLMQGAGINIDRGAEELVEAMDQVDEQCELWFVGNGDVIPCLKKKVAKGSSQDKIKFVDKVPFAELKRITRQAFLGFSLDKDTNLNYRFSLPNKLFDYIHADVPVVVSPLVEPAKIVRDNGVGIVLDRVDPCEIAKAINALVKDEESYQKMKASCATVKQQLNWQNEQKQLISTYETILG